MGKNIKMRTLLRIDLKQNKKTKEVFATAHAANTEPGATHDLMVESIANVFSVKPGLYKDVKQELKKRRKGLTNEKRDNRGRLLRKGATNE